MKLADHPDLTDIRASLIEGLIAFLSGSPDTYPENTVTECEKILAEHLAALEAADNREQALSVVERTVLRLNELNESCGCDLIETDEREQLAGFIIKAGALRGFNSESEDVTEPWREW